MPLANAQYAVFFLAVFIAIQEKGQKKRILAILPG
jgi:hypothetical protein